MLGRSRSPVSFLALGGVWLDEIRVGKQVMFDDALGGSVTFATLGARLFLRDDPGRIKLVFIAGHDFPSSALETFNSWEVDMTVNWRRDQPSARGVVQYEHNSTNRMSYQRLTCPLLTLPSDLTSLDILSTRSFHFFAGPKELQTQVRTIHQTFALSTYTRDRDHPLMIWEPHPKSCSADTLEAHLVAAAEVSLFSPNHIELGLFFGDATSSNNGDVGNMHGMKACFDKRKIEQRAAIFARTGCDVVIRCAENGCCVVRAGGGAGPAGGGGGGTDLPVTWLPAFHLHNPLLPPGSKQKVVDPTGAGNAFLGGWAVGYLETGGDSIAAAEYGSVAASLALEQVGLPVLSRTSGHDLDGEEEEIWNGVNVRQRLEEYRLRLMQHV